MILGKNAAVRVAALVGSAGALIGTWGLVHQNPPPAAADAPAPAPTATAQSKSTAAPARAKQRVPLNAPVRHTRTRVS